MDARRLGQRPVDVRNRVHLRPAELVGQRRHRVFDDRRGRRFTPTGGADARRGIRGNPPGDGSSWINQLYWRLADYAGSAARIIGYANAYDFFNMWRVRPPGLRVIAAGYGSNPNLPGQVAHQYTDGQGYSPNLPQGCPPFGRCDMNSADGLTPQQFAAACGIATNGGWLMALTDDEQAELLTKVRDIWDQLRGPDGAGWPQLGQNSDGQNLTPVDAIAAIKKDVESPSRRAERLVPRRA